MIELFVKAVNDSMLLAISPRSQSYMSGRVLNTYLKVYQTQPTEYVKVTNCACFLFLHYCFTRAHFRGDLPYLGHLDWLKI